MLNSFALGIGYIILICGGLFGFLVLLSMPVFLSYYILDSAYKRYKMQREFIKFLIDKREKKNANK